MFYLTTFYAWVAKWSNALDLRSSLSGFVGSNPTSCNFFISFTAKFFIKLKSLSDYKFLKTGYSNRGTRGRLPLNGFSFSVHEII